MFFFLIILSYGVSIDCITRQPETKESTSETPTSLAQSVLSIHNISLPWRQWISQQEGGVEGVIVGGGGEADNWLTSPVAFRSLQTHQDEPVLHPDHCGCEERLGPACCRGSVVTGFKCSLSAPSTKPSPHAYCHFRLDLTGPAGLGGNSSPSSSTPPTPESFVRVTGVRVASEVTHLSVNSNSSDHRGVDGLNGEKVLLYSKVVVGGRRLADPGTTPGWNQHQQWKHTSRLLSSFIRPN